MEHDAELNGIGIEDVCQRARIHGRAAEVLRLMAAGHDVEAVAERLGVKVGTVYTYVHRARTKLKQAQLRHELREFYGFLLHEALPGPRPSDPRQGLYRVTGPGEGERVSVNAGPLVTVEDLMRARTDGKPS